MNAVGETSLLPYIDGTVIGHLVVCDGAKKHISCNGSRCSPRSIVKAKLNGRRGRTVHGPIMGGDILRVIVS